MMTSIVVGILGILIGLISLYKWVVIINAFLTFVRPDPNNQIVIILDLATAPAYKLVKKIGLKTNFNGIELAPLVVVVALEIIMKILGAIGK